MNKFDSNSFCSMILQYNYVCPYNLYVVLLLSSTGTVCPGTLVNWYTSSDILFRLSSGGWKYIFIYMYVVSPLYTAVWFMHKLHFHTTCANFFSQKSSMADHCCHKTYPNITAFHSMMLLSVGAPLTPAGGSSCNLKRNWHDLCFFIPNG